MRIRATPIVDTQNGQLHDNRIVYNDTASEFSTAVNVGPETLPNTYIVCPQSLAQPGESDAGRLDAVAADAEKLAAFTAVDRDGADRCGARLGFRLGKVDRQRERHAASRSTLPTLQALRRATPGERLQFPAAAGRSAWRRLDIGDHSGRDDPIAGFLAGDSH